MGLCYDGQCACTDYKWPDGSDSKEFFRYIRKHNRYYKAANMADDIEKFREAFGRAADSISESKIIRYILSTECRRCR